MLKSKSRGFINLRQTKCLVKRLAGLLVAKSGYKHPSRPRLYRQFSQMTAKRHGDGLYPLCAHC